ncbi:metal ABC transporter permease|uniref:Zinc transport system permease protein n=1 Tax=Dendrosporobacter quercicolus TaxID=146817 RepID=A0A1G9QMC2_9FIRM|nr:metal ABC transporter permease [Dendrosporobacter quercicolus]NSL48297.1 metal ABC transporter permease [Dendrosporobacter quercicolus DSM 1736]SDM12168.1 zinc transport system permease protein [Dendrosporobacter quercicolus]
MLDLLQYDFMQRALVAGVLVGLLCPVIGVFLILRRQSLIGDGLGHIAFAGVAAGWMFGVYPVLSATVVTVLSALGIEALRAKRPAFADMALAIFFYTGIAVAVVLSSMMKSNNVNLISYLFGSIVTVSTSDVQTIAGLTLVVLAVLRLIFKELVFITFDEEAALVSGLPVRKINTALAVLTALTVALSMRIVGILLVSALMVIPVAASLQLSRSFRSTIINAVIFSEVSVLAGLLISFTADLATGGTIVLTAVAIFVLTFAVRQLNGLKAPGAGCFKQ